MGWLLTVIEYSFYLSALGLLIYYRLFFYKLAKHKLTLNPKREFSPVSVIICAKNERVNLAKNLPTILTQRYPNYEVVVVDDHSVDKTWELLIEMAKEHSNLKPVKFEDEKKSEGKKQVLEYGIAHSNYDHLLLTDADCYPVSENWILSMTSVFSDKKEIVLGVGMYEKRKGWLNKLIQLDTVYIAIQYMSFALKGIPYMSVGRNVAYKKSLFYKAGGLKSHYHIKSGDDDLFINDAGTNENVGVMYSPKSFTLSTPKTSFKDWVRQKRRHLSTGFHYDKKNLFYLGLYQFFVFLFYHSMILMVCFSVELEVVLTVFLLKKIVQISIYKRIFAKLELGGMYISSTVFDILSLYLNSFIGGINLITRNKGTW